MVFRLIIAALVLVISGLGSAMTADEIIAKIQENLAPQNYRIVYEFINYRKDGTMSAYEVMFESRDINHNRGYFRKPEREKGREILRLDDSVWTFVPSVGRVVRIADRESFAGGDFSNADVLRIDWLNKYRATMVKETENQWVIDLIAKSAESPYAKMRVWVAKKDNQPVQQQFFDSQGTLLKKALYGSVKKFEKTERPTHIVMENTITKQKSEMKVISFGIEKDIPLSKFSVDSLGK